MLADIYRRPAFSEEKERRKSVWIWGWEERWEGKLLGMQRQINRVEIMSFEFRRILASETGSWRR